MNFSVPDPPNPRRPRPVAYLLVFLGLFALINIGVNAAFSGNPLLSPAPKPTAELQPSAEYTALEVELQRAILEADEVLAYHLFDVEIEKSKISEDGSWALARLLLVDRTTHQVLPTEPGLALAQKVGGKWMIYLQSDPEWANRLDQLPGDLLSPDAQASWKLRLAAYVAAVDDGPFTGYLLPWAGGLEKFLTRSITHGIGSSTHYAFDFAQPGYPSGMFPVHASKGGP